MTTQLPHGYVWAEHQVKLWQRREFPDHVNPAECLVVEMRQPDDWICLSEGEKYERKRQFLTNAYGEEHFHFEGISPITKHHRVFVPWDGLYTYFEVSDSQFAFSQLQATEVWLKTVCGWTPDQFRRQYAAETNLAKSQKEDPALIKHLLRGLRIQDRNRHFTVMATPTSGPSTPTPPSLPHPPKPSSQQQPREQQQPPPSSQPQSRPQAATAPRRPNPQALKDLFHDTKCYTERNRIRQYFEHMGYLGTFLHIELSKVICKLFYPDGRTLLGMNYMVLDMLRNIALLFGAPVPTPAPGRSQVQISTDIMSWLLFNRVIPFAAHTVPINNADLADATRRYQLRCTLMSYLWMVTDTLTSMFRGYSYNPHSYFFGAVCHDFLESLVSTHQSIARGQMDGTQVAVQRIRSAGELFKDPIFGMLPQRFFGLLPMEQALQSWKLIKWSNLGKFQFRFVPRIAYSISSFELSRLRTIEQQQVETCKQTAKWNARHPQDSYHHHNIIKIAEQDQITTIATNLVAVLGRAATNIIPVEDSESFLCHFPMPVGKTRQTLASDIRHPRETTPVEAKTFSNGQIKISRAGPQPLVPSDLPSNDIFLLQKQMESKLGIQIGEIFNAHMIAFRAHHNIPTVMTPPAAMMPQPNKRPLEISGGAEGPLAKKARGEEGTERLSDLEAAEVLLSLFHSR